MIWSQHSQKQSSYQKTLQSNYSFCSQLSENIREHIIANPQHHILKYPLNSTFFILFSDSHTGVARRLSFLTACSSPNHNSPQNSSTTSLTVSFPSFCNLFSGFHNLNNKVGREENTKCIKFPS